MWPNTQFPTPRPSFKQPVEIVGVEPDEGELATVYFSVAWLPYVLGALNQLLLQATWKSDDIDVINTEQLRALRLIELFAIWQDLKEYGTPFWDEGNGDEADDTQPADTQPWYGHVTDPNAPAGELDFVESALLWTITALVAVATFELGGLAPAIAFHTAVEKFIIIQKRGDAAETIRFVVDGEDMKFINTAPYAPGDLIKTQIITPQTGGEHDLLIISTVAE